MQCAIFRYFTCKLHKHNKTCSSAWADTRYSIRQVYGPRRKKCAAYAEYRTSGERLVPLRCIWGLRQRHERAKERGDIPRSAHFQGLRPLCLPACQPILVAARVHRALQALLRCDQPLIPPAWRPETKYFWQQMNTISTGTRLATLMANT